jgi:hypothetical protein
MMNLNQQRRFQFHINLILIHFNMIFLLEWIINNSFKFKLVIIILQALHQTVAYIPGEVVNSEDLDMWTLKDNHNQKFWKSLLDNKL